MLICSLIVISMQEFSLEKRLKPNTLKNSVEERPSLVQTNRSQCHNLGTHRRVYVTIVDTLLADKTCNCLLKNIKTYILRKNSRTRKTPSLKICLMSSFWLRYGSIQKLKMQKSTCLTKFIFDGIYLQTKSMVKSLLSSMKDRNLYPFT